MKVRYWILDHGERCARDARTLITVADPGRPGQLASEVAHDYHAAHAGWEADWPLRFCVQPGTGAGWGKVQLYSIDRVVEPAFRPRRITKTSMRASRRLMRVLAAR